MSKRVRKMHYRNGKVCYAPQSHYMNNLQSKRSEVEMHYDCESIPTLKAWGQVPGFGVTKKSKRKGANRDGNKA